MAAGVNIEMNMCVTGIAVNAAPSQQATKMMPKAAAPVIAQCTTPSLPVEGDLIWDSVMIASIEMGDGRPSPPPF